MINAAKLAQQPTNSLQQAALPQSLQELTDFRRYSRERTTALTPLMTKVIKGVHSRCASKHWLPGAGTLVTTVIRAVKAWVQCGLDGQLQLCERRSGINSSSGSSTHCTAGSSSSSSSGGSSGDSSSGSNSGSSGSRSSGSSRAAGSALADPFRDASDGPPSYILETFVVFVLEQQLQQGLADRYRYGNGLKELNLFMDVLEAASTLLRPSLGTSAQLLKPICVTHLYTAEEAELFRGCWGPAALYSPFILHPVDPSYNCTLHTESDSWGALADAAQLLHGHLQQLLQQSDGDPWGAVLVSTTLGRAVKAFEA
jgi:hypothetical protein